MATLDHDEIVSALLRLGELAVAEGQSIELVVVGGAAMVLGYSARFSTRDVDAIFLTPPPAQSIRDWAAKVAKERSWPDDWLNDAAKGYLINPTLGPVLLSGAGIKVRQPVAEQLLAMKLCAWRDDVDITDAARLLDALDPSASRDEVWLKLLSFLLPGRELKAKLAFDELWEQVHGNN